MTPSNCSQQFLQPHHSILATIPPVSDATMLQVYRTARRLSPPGTSSPPLVSIVPAVEGLNIAEVEHHLMHDAIPTPAGPASTAPNPPATANLSPVAPHCTRYETSPFCALSVPIPARCGYGASAAAPQRCCPQSKRSTFQRIC
jgi:hypothetical protein